MPQTHRVTIVQSYLPHYRVELFARMRARLAAHDVELRVSHGSVKADVAWTDLRRHRPIPFTGSRLMWQPALDLALRSDLVIVEQANRLALNYVLMMMRAFGGPRLGLWGHGRDFRASPGAPANRLKRLLVKRCDWWFAYTEGVARFVEETGFPRERITALQNTIDTEALRKDCEAVTSDEIAALRARHGAKGRVLVFCGRLTPEKRLPFLFDAFLAIRERVPGSVLLVIGDGPEAPLVRAAAAADPAIIPVGAAYGREKAAYLRMADALLMPGLVGLVVLDAFVAGIPLVTTAWPGHSPEIEYLENGVNGVVSADEAAAFADAVASLLEDETRLDALKRGARTSAAAHPLDGMVERFTAGILSALRTDDQRKSARSRIQAK